MARSAGRDATTFWPGVTGLTADGSRQMFEINHITFAYNACRVLDDITFDVAPGEIVALLGPNGAGKTTLLKVLAGALMQDAGTIRLDEVDALARPISYRRGIGFLSERCPLYADMTVEEYLIYRLRLKGERHMRVRRRVSEALEMCGLTPWSQKTISRLSQGCRKRVGLADALMMHPKLLLLDDLLDGLDSEQRQKIAVVLANATREPQTVTLSRRGKSMEVKLEADGVALMKGGD